MVFGKVIYKLYLPVGQSTDKAYKVALPYGRISTLGDRNSFGSTANRRTGDKNTLKGNPIDSVPQNNVSRTAKVSNQSQS